MLRVVVLFVAWRRKRTFSSRSHFSSRQFGSFGPALLLFHPPCHYFPPSDSFLPSLSRRLFVPSLTPSHAVCLSIIDCWVKKGYFCYVAQPYLEIFPYPNNRTAAGKKSSETIKLAYFIARKFRPDPSFFLESTQYLFLHCDTFFKAVVGSSVRFVPEKKNGERGRRIIFFNLSPPSFPFSSRETIRRDDNFTPPYSIIATVSTRSRLSRDQLPRRRKSGTQSTQKIILSFRTSFNDARH